jgi:hypothetical protein
MKRRALACLASWLVTTTALAQPEADTPAPEDPADALVGDEVVSDEVVGDEAEPPPALEEPPPEPEASAADSEHDTWPQAPKEPSLHRHLALGAQWFFVQDKSLFGPILRGGYEWFWVHTESSFLTAKESPTFSGGILGNQFGIYAAVSPLNTDRAEFHLALGGDFYWLYRIHGDLWEAALSARASGHFWFSRQLGAFATVRAYPASSGGLELGTDREGEGGMPILLSIGLEWRPQ